MSFTMWVVIYDVTKKHREVFNKNELPLYFISISSSGSKRILVIRMEYNDIKNSRWEGTEMKHKIY